MAEIDRQIEATLEFLAATYPVFAEGKPLAIGIREQLIERHPDIETRLLRIALSKHCKRSRYRKVLSEETSRYGLDGQPAGVVTEEQREQAKTELEERKARFKAASERRKEQARLEKEAAKRKAERTGEPIQGKALAQKTEVAAPKPAAGLGRPVITLKKRTKSHAQDVTV